MGISKLGTYYRNYQEAQSIPMYAALKNSTIWVAGCALLTALIYGSLFYPPMSLGGGDPDRYFHLWVAQQTSLHGLVHAIPQVDNLGWAEFFPDKEFLFHVLTALGYRLHGDWGALSLVPVSVFSLLLLCFFSFRSKKIFHLPAWMAFLIASSSIFACVAFTFRLFLLRPHLLGILFWVMSLVGLLSSRRWVVLLGVLFFALSYHAFYMPFVLAFAFGLAQLVLQVRVDWKLLLIIPVALLVGIVLNPYFPDNAMMGWLTLKIALGIGLPVLNRGQELNSQPLSEALNSAKFQLAILLSSLSYLIYLFRTKSEKSFQFVFLLILSAVICCMYLKSPRANEYWLPTSAFLLASLVSLLRSRGFWIRKLTVCLPLFSVLFLGVGAIHFYRDALKTRYLGQTEVVFDALARIPVSTSMEKVFNCNWTSGSLILYKRPDLRFVDLLDPAFLYVYNPEAHELRKGLNEGHYMEPSGPILRAFRSRYVLCDNPILNSILIKDPGVRLLGSAGALNGEMTFKLLGEIPK